jgi:Xaa-Pro dipeptidase|tara:strand:+ start:3817 stop:4494 length:678 start_codon:yes stop_codon:yes gene_type:complete
MNSSTKKLIEAEKKALYLFREIEKRGLIIPGKTEKELNTTIYDLAYELYGIELYWHKRIVRAGKNTLKPYDENPEDLILQKNDILFIDFGPVFEEWEADFGRTYVIGNDPLKIKLTQDIEKAWYEGKEYFDSQKKITGAELYFFTHKLAKKYKWEFGGEIAGHLIGQFPHERLEKELKTNYIHPHNHIDMRALNQKGDARSWILEIHFVDKEMEIGGFFEQLLTF